MLEDIDCMGATIDDIDFVGHCPLLRHLRISKCYGIATLEPVSACKKLTTLECRFNPMITDLEGLADLVDLVSLDFYYCRKLWDATHISGCSELTSICFIGCDFIDISPLECCKKLVHLSASSDESFDEKFPRFEFLETVDLSNANVRWVD
jgi:hypothetical protein